MVAHQRGILPRHLPPLAAPVGPMPGGLRLFEVGVSAPRRVLRGFMALLRIETHATGDERSDFLPIDGIGNEIIPFASRKPIYLDS